MDDRKLDRIEAKLDKVVDRLGALEVDLARQEQKVLKRILGTLVLICSLAFAVVKILVGAK